MWVKTVKSKIEMTSGGKQRFDVYGNDSCNDSLYARLNKAYNKIFIKKLCISFFCLYLGILNAYYLCVLGQYSTTGLVFCFAGLFFGGKELLLSILQKYRISKKSCYFSHGMISEKISGSGFRRYFPSLIVNNERCVPINRETRKSQTGDSVRVITIPLFENKVVRYVMR